MAKQIFLSPRNYIIQKAKQLPIIECWIETEYKVLGITNVVVVRQEPGGKYTAAIICVDIFCLGVKNAFCNCHLDEEFYERMMGSFSSEPMKITPVFAHNLIYGALDYASELGFTPHKDFAFCENVLDDTLIDDGIDKIEFGVGGIPHYFQGPDDNAKQIIAHLNRVLGEGNFGYTAIAD